MIQIFSNGNKSAFGRQAGIQSGVLAGLLGGRYNKPSFEVLQRLASTYPQVREEWLLLGTGDMLKEAYDPDALAQYLANARALLAKYDQTVGLKQAQEANAYLIESRARLASVRPALNVMLNDTSHNPEASAIAKEYESVLIALNTLILTNVDILADAEPEEISYPHQSPKLIPSGFIEVLTPDDKTTLINVRAISHIYPSDESTTIIELATPKVSITSLLTYNAILSLIVLSTKPI